MILVKLKSIQLLDSIAYEPERILTQSEKESVTSVQFLSSHVLYYQADEKDIEIVDALADEIITPEEEASLMKKIINYLKFW